MTPYPTDAVKTTMRARFNELSDRLSRLSHAREDDARAGAAPAANPLNGNGNGNGNGNLAQAGGLPNPGFEPEASTGTTTSTTTGRLVQLTVARASAPEGTARPNPAGWQIAGNPANSAEIDLTQFHSGRGSLRLDAQAPPASVISDRFVPDPVGR